MGRYETAEYEVLKKENNIEIRSYKEYMTAAIREENLVSASGFGAIFRYISGENEEDRKISMTTPVLNELTEHEVTTEFVMPKIYTKDSLPLPRNKAITFKEVPAKVVLCITFNGTTRRDRLRFYEKLLVDYAREHNLETVGTVRLARYNPPFIPGFLKRNELHMDIRSMAKE